MSDAADISTRLADLRRTVERLSKRRDRLNFNLSFLPTLRGSRLYVGTNVDGPFVSLDAENLEVVGAVDRAVHAEIAIWEAEAAHLLASLELAAPEGEDG